jgi:hypothetical protein
MTASKNVIMYSDVKVKNLIYSDDILTPDENYVISKIWCKENKHTRPHTLHIELPYLKIHEIQNDGDYIVLLPDNIETFMDSLDRSTLDFITHNRLINKYRMKDKHNGNKFTYETLINDKNFSFDTFKIRIIKGKTPTLFYSPNKDKIDFEHAKNLLNTAEKIKLILKIDGLIMDLKNNIMYTNVIAREILIPELDPQIIELTDYSFINSNNNEINKKYAEDDIVLNIQSDSSCAKNNNDNDCDNDEKNSDDNDERNSDDNNERNSDDNERNSDDNERNSDDNNERNSDDNERNSDDNERNSNDNERHSDDNERNSNDNERNSDDNERNSNDNERHSDDNDGENNNNEELKFDSSTSSDHCHINNNINSDNNTHSKNNSSKLNKNLKNLSQHKEVNNDSSDDSVSSEEKPKLTKNKNKKKIVVKRASSETKVRKPRKKK